MEGGTAAPPGGVVLDVAGVGDVPPDFRFFIRRFDFFSPESLDKSVIVAGADADAGEGESILESTLCSRLRLWSFLSFFVLLC